MQILSDDDTRALAATDAVAAVRSWLVAHAGRERPSPPRAYTTVGDQRMILTAGGLGGGAMGARLSAGARAPLEHVTILWDGDGWVDAVLVGKEAGARRTGAVAAVAADLLAPQGPVRVGMIGSGRNGWTQIWGLTGVREVRDLTVYSPNPEHRERFAARAREELGLAARAVDGARRATEEMDIVVLWTTSENPVIEAEWVGGGAHVTTIGPKSARAHEAPVGLLSRVERVVSDSPDDLSDPFAALGPAPLVSLGSLFDAVPAKANDEVSLFLYSGLGGTDAAFGRAVAERARRDG
jgi:ornithine cyclodeaminase